LCELHQVILSTVLDYPFAQDDLFFWCPCEVEKERKKGKKAIQAHFCKTMLPAV